MRKPTGRALCSGAATRGAEQRNLANRCYPVRVDPASNHQPQQCPQDTGASTSFGSGSGRDRVLRR